MMVRAGLLLAVLGTASAAPAIVWERQAASAPQHHSGAVDASSLLKSAVGGTHDESEASVVFLVGRHNDGREMLGDLASSGSLPKTEAKYGTAHAIHHHVDGVESARSVARDATRGLADPTATVLEVTLGEFSSKMTSLANPAAPSAVEEPEPTDGNHVHSRATKEAHKRSRNLSAADVLIVSVGPDVDPTALDAAVVSAVEHPKVRNVLLTAQRSVSEVKRDRSTAQRRRAQEKKQQRQAVEAPRRRLEDQDEGDDANNNNNNNQDEDENIAYINMTPNILAGILFTLMFAFVTNVGIGCMGMIQGQVVYVKKMPSIGREA